MCSCVQPLHALPHRPPRLVAGGACLHVFNVVPSCAFVFLRPREFRVKIESGIFPEFHGNLSSSLYSAAVQWKHG